MVLQNSDTIVYSLNNIDKKAVKSIDNLYTKLPHDKLECKIKFIVDFAFKGRDKTCIRLPARGVATRGKKTKGELGFSKTLTIFAL